MATSMDADQMPSHLASDWYPSWLVDATIVGIGRVRVKISYVLSKS